MSTDLVLTTINTPHTRQLSAQELAACLRDQTAAKAVPDHMSSFFGEVDPALQAEFAEKFGVTQAQLAVSAKAFASCSGESYPLSA